VPYLGHVTSKGVINYIEGEYVNRLCNTSVLMKHVTNTSKLLELTTKGT